jgi:hypothetical protein
MAANMRTRFDQFLSEQSRRGEAPVDRERLFREFQDWMRKN